MDGKEEQGRARGGREGRASTVKRARRSHAAVDATFVRRLKFLLGIVVPSWRSEEAFLLFTQSFALARVYKVVHIAAHRKRVATVYRR